MTKKPYKKLTAEEVQEHCDNKSMMPDGTLFMVTITPPPNRQMINCDRSNCTLIPRLDYRKGTFVEWWTKLFKEMEDYVDYEAYLEFTPETGLLHWHIKMCVLDMPSFLHWKAVMHYQYEMKIGIAIKVVEWIDDVHSEYIKKDYKRMKVCLKKHKKSSVKKLDDFGYKCQPYRKMKS